ncbi:MAG TPA: serine/threonine protein kinase, partial [Planctomycetes bacterium]|nr:serine/threonine protein kinase [Planctomycetota bacterium]
MGEAEGTHFYAMEYIDGPSLAALLAGMREKAGGGGAKGSGTWDPEWISSTARRTAELAEGLEKAHLQGLVHRDVKPSNILVDSSGRFVLVDFGLVREEEAETLTRSGEMVGTLSYMSPEAVGRRRVDARADVYGLGATLYEALTLALPFPGATEHEVQGAIMFKEPIPPRKLNPRIHRDLETIVLHALEKDPDRRYATAADLAGDLRRFLR